MARSVTDNLKLYLMQVSLRPEYKGVLGATMIEAGPEDPPPRLPHTGQGILSFAQWCNPPLAEAWLDEGLKYSVEQVAATSPSEQDGHVRRVWECLGKAFRALNCNLYAWEKFRRVCEIAWGSGHGSSPEGGYSNLDEFNPNWTYAGEWRREAARIYTRVSGNSDAVTFVRFGSFVYRFGPGGPEGVHAGTPGGLVPHVADRHRVWLLADGMPGPTEPIVPEAMGVSCPTAQHWECAAWDVVGSPATRVFLQFLPPMRWYWNLLRAPVPGLRVGVDHGTLFNVQRNAFSARPSAGDLSLIEYARAIGGVELAREVRLDVLRKNTALSHELRMPTPDLVGFGEAEILRAQGRSNEQTNKLSQLFGSMGTALMAGAVIPGPVGAAFVVAGFVAGAVSIIVGALGSFGEVERQVDVFGRRKPVPEAFRITDDQSENTLRLLLDGVGEGLGAGVSPGYMLPPAWASVQVGTAIGDSPGSILIGPIVSALLFGTVKVARPQRNGAPAPVDILLDGRPVPPGGIARGVAQGRHTITALAGGNEYFRAMIDVVSGQQASVTVPDAVPSSEGGGSILVPALIVAGMGAGAYWLYRRRKR